MILTPEQITEDVKSLIVMRNRIKTAIAAGEHKITVPAVAATATTPAQPESVKSTGQLPNASGYAHTLAVQLISHLKLIGGDEATVRDLEQSLNASAPKPEAKK